MKILTADEMRVTDRVTTDRFGISSLELMEHAGRATARFILRELPLCRRIVVLCGKGNNGGDGLVAARYLVEAGCAVSVRSVVEVAGGHTNSTGAADYNQQLSERGAGRQYRARVLE